MIVQRHRSPGHLITGEAALDNDLAQQAPSEEQNCSTVIPKGNPSCASVTVRVRSCSAQVFDCICVLVNPDEIWSFCRSAVACTHLKSCITCKRASNFFQAVSISVTESSSTPPMAKKEVQFSPTAIALRLAVDAPLTFLNKRKQLTLFIFLIPSCVC